MSALRVHYPNQPIALIDLGPGSACVGGVRGTFCVPERAAQPHRPHPPRTPQEADRRAAEAEYSRRYRERNRERVRAADRERKAARRNAA